MTQVSTAVKQFSDRINRIEPSATLAVVNEAARLRGEGVDLVDLGAGEPHFGPPPAIRAAVVEAAQQGSSKYTHVAGTIELRQAIASRHAADFGTDYKPSEVVAATGGKQALFNAIQVLIDHGDEVIVPVPYWVSFKDIVQYAGGKCVFVETDENKGFTLTADMVERAITPRTKAIILNSPNNPTGAAFDSGEMRAIVEMATQRGIYVIDDECYVHLQYDGEPFSAAAVPGTREHVVVIGSLSKTYAMTGWRLGYAMGSAAVVSAITKLQSQSTSNPSSLIQRAGVAALDGSQDCIAEMKQDYMRLRDIALQGLSGIPGVRCQRPHGAFYAYPNIGAYIGKRGIGSAAELARKLLVDAHVVTVPGEAFGTTEHIRLSYATSADQLRRGIERIKAYLKSLD
jgi:aspartate aminotransferase